MSRIRGQTMVALTFGVSLLLGVGTYGIIHVAARQPGVEQLTQPEVGTANGDFLPTAVEVRVNPDGPDEIVESSQARPIWITPRDGGYLTTSHAYSDRLLPIGAIACLEGHDD